MNRIQIIELGSILLNQLFFLIGILFLGWTLYETLILYWIEPLVALLLQFYVQIIVPALHGSAQSQVTQSNNGGRLVKFLFFASYILIMQAAGLWAMVEILKPTQSIWMQTDMWVLLVLFVVVLLLPVWLLERQGIRPQMRHLPMQSKILLHPIQAITSYLILAAALYIFYSSASAWIAILVIVIAKSIVETSLFFRLKV